GLPSSRHRRVQKELRQAVAAVAYRIAVDLEDIPELHVAKFAALAAYEQQVRFQLAMRDEWAVGFVRVLDVMLLGDDALNGVLEADHVVRDARQDCLKRRAILCCEHGGQKQDDEKSCSMHVWGGPFRPAGRRPWKGRPTESASAPSGSGRETGCSDRGRSRPSSSRRPGPEDRPFRHR